MIRYFSFILLLSVYFVSFNYSSPISGEKNNIKEISEKYERFSFSKENLLVENEEDQDFKGFQVQILHCFINKIKIKKTTRIFISFIYYKKNLLNTHIDLPPPVH